MRSTAGAHPIFFASIRTRRPLARLRLRFTAPRTIKSSTYIGAPLSPTTGMALRGNSSSQDDSASTSEARVISKGLTLRFRRARLHARHLQPVVMWQDGTLEQASRL